MFFVLSKLLNVLLSPFIWVLLLWLVARFGKKAFKKRLRVVSIVLLLLFSNGFLFQTVVSLWEVAPVAPSALHGVNTKAVVLGGMASENETTGLPRFGQSADRLFQSLWLLRTGKVDTLIISGGRGELFGKQMPEGELLRRYLRGIEMLDGRILVESASRNTRENAVNTAALFVREGFEKHIVLVTSAFHMRRARACFEKLGFCVEVYPADPLASVQPPSWRDFVVPSPVVLGQWQLLFQEWVGFGAYWLNNYI